MLSVAGECQLSQHDARLPDVCEPEEPHAPVPAGARPGAHWHGGVFQQLQHHEELPRPAALLAGPLPAQGQGLQRSREGL